MDRLRDLIGRYSRDVVALAASHSSTEPTYYPALQTLLNGVLRESGLPFEVRTNTSETRREGGTDRPDFAFYDGTGDFAVVLGEVKTPRTEIVDLAGSTDRNDQVGRYLAQTGVVLLTNVRGFGLLTVDPDYEGDGAVPPEARRLGEVVELWPSVTALSRGAAPPEEALEALVELVETAVTEFAPIGEPESLARILARLARRAKAALPARFSRAVQPLLDDFAAALGIHFIDEEGQEFLRSSLVQTAFYGLFAGWTLWRHAGSEGRAFRWENLSEYLKIAFLGELFHEFRHPKRMRELGLAPHLDRAQAALERVESERFFARFGLPHVVAGDSAEGAVASNAILYFYEPFLEAFDPELRKQLGVWYTPQEIVSYQVRKVDRLLREELDCARGFADDRVVVLDPCCGTGAYLIEVLRCVANQLEAEGAGALLGARLLDAFCRRILGFEILTAPFVVAQLQLYLILSDLGVEPDTEHRPAVFLTNALVGWEGPEQLKLQFPELQEEHEAARRVKREEKIIVILGNPPYNRFAGAPIDEEADLVDHYKGIRRDAKGRQVGQSELYRRFGVRKHLLDDLYVRFFRLAEQRIGERAEYGIVSFISNYSYLVGRSHPLMRESLLRNFDVFWIDSLNGDKYRTGKMIPQGLPGGGTADQSVFSTEQDPRGIQVGTAITTLLKRKRAREKNSRAEVRFREFWGLSLAKRRALADEEPRAYETIEVLERNNWRLVPWSTSGGFEDWADLESLFPEKFMGVHTGKDAAVMAFTEKELKDRFATYFNTEVSHEAMAKINPALMKKANEFEDPIAFRVALQSDPEAGDPLDKVKLYHYRPLDVRFVWYETRRRVFPRGKGGTWSGCLVQRYGENFARAIRVDDNYFLCAVSQPRKTSESRTLTSSGVLADLHVSDRGTTCFPLLVEDSRQRNTLFDNGDEHHANLAATAWRVFRTTWNLDGDLTGHDAMELARQLFHLAMAVAHSPRYERDHQEALAHDWIRLPIPKKRETLAEVAELGETAARLLDPLADPTPFLERYLGAERRHLGLVTTRDPSGAVRGESDLVVTISYYASAKGRWEERPPRPSEAQHAAWGVTTGDLYLNDDVFLAHVPERVWRYEIGGYPVIKKWLGYRDVRRRPKRGLSLDEADHLRGMVHRIAALLVLHDELDEAYERALEESFTAEELELR